jgi:Tol biopolymer transport system component
MTLHSLSILIAICWCVVAGDMAEQTLLDARNEPLEAGSLQVPGFPQVTGSYLGQTPPGRDPERFFFDVVPSGYRLHSAPAFMPGAQEVYFSAMDFSVRFSERIFVMKMAHGAWSALEVAPFSGEFIDGSPSISRDGRYLVFSSGRNPDQTGLNEDGERNLWYVSRTDPDWSEPQMLRVNPGEWENGSDISESGNLFFDSPDIHRMTFPPSDSSHAEKLGTEINTGFTELHPCVAPDERILIFYSNRPGHLGSSGGDLFISFKGEDGAWQPAMNLGTEFNAGHLSTSFPRLSPDGRYLFFLKLVAVPWQAEVFWVSVDARDELRK